jgi:hypothetical protein
VHLVHEPPLERAIGGHTLAEKRHLEGARLANGGGHEQGGPAVRHQADVHEGEPEVGGLRRQHEVAGECERGADPHCGAVHGGHDGLLEPPHAGDDRVVEPVELLADVREAVVRVRVEPRLEVRARREAAAGARDQHGANAVLGGRLGHGLLQLPPELVGPRVQRVGAVEGDAADTAVLFPDDIHGRAA